MAIFKLNHILLLFLFVLGIVCLAGLPQHTYANDHRPSVLLRRYHVHIISNFTEDFPPLLVHCRSKGDDLGAQFLLPKQEYLIRFKIDYFRRTRFTCEVETDQAKTEFTAFKCSRDEDRCRRGNCYWSVGPDGFFFSKDMKNWEEEYQWPPTRKPTSTA